MAARERLAGWLRRTGALDLVLAARARLPMRWLAIVTYHHLDEPGPDYELDAGVADATPAQFRQQVEEIAGHFNVVTVDQLCRALDGAALPPNPALITFDDGYRSCHEVALPILREVGVPATFFIATGFVTERRLYWWDRIAYLMSRSKRPTVAVTYPRTLQVDPGAGSSRRVLADLVKNTPGLDLPRFLAELAAAAEVDWSDPIERGLADRMIMTWDQIRGLADAGMDIESHTRRHRVLQTLDAGDLADELAGSREDLERELNRPVRALAYPVGRSIVEHAAIRQAVAAAGYRLAFTNATGSSRIGAGQDPLDLGRLAMDRELSDSLFLAQLAIPQLGYRGRGKRGYLAR